MYISRYKYLSSAGIYWIEYIIKVRTYNGSVDIKFKKSN